jgi:hypothetical protein
MELKSAMFTNTQMQQIEQASAALSGGGDGMMSRLELQQLYDEVPRIFLNAYSVIRSFAALFCQPPTFPFPLSCLTTALRSTKTLSRCWSCQIPKPCCTSPA